MIGTAIDAACRWLRGSTGLNWRLSRDDHYQMSNRFAWASKLVERGRPVILVYLGLLNAEEMRAANTTPFSSAAEWDEVVKAHSKPLFPEEAWNREWNCNGQALIPIIRSIEVSLQPPYAIGFANM